MSNPNFPAVNYHFTDQLEAMIADLSPAERLVMLDQLLTVIVSNSIKAPEPLKMVDAMSGANALMAAVRYGELSRCVTVVEARKQGVDLQGPFTDKVREVLRFYFEGAATLPTLDINDLEGDS